MEVPSTWGWGAPDKEKRRLEGYFRALPQLREPGLNGCVVVSAYHKRRIAPLMARTLPLYRMIAGADLFGTVMSSEEIDEPEVWRRLKETFEPPVAYPDPQPPAMLPDEGALVIVRYFSLSLILFLSPCVHPLSLLLVHFAGQERFLSVCSTTAGGR